MTISLVLCLGVLAGCRHEQGVVSYNRLSRGLVIVLPGIEGASEFNRQIVQGLDMGGVNWAIETYDWTSSLGPLYNLRAQERNRRQAINVLARITRYRDEHGDNPVMLVGQSGGAAIAAWVAEAMPPDEKLEGIIMLAPSLSPTYQLDWAISNTRRGIVSFHSQRDWVMLGLGTTIAGTMDGQHASSAGLVGFHHPPQEEPQRMYQRLYQVAWNPAMARAGHSGLHLTSGAERFVSQYVAPLIIADQWDKDLVEEIAAGERLSAKPAQ